jgi:hypothetical protein
VSFPLVHPHHPHSRPVVLHCSAASLETPYLSVVWSTIINRCLETGGLWKLADIHRRRSRRLASYPQTEFACIAAHAVGHSRGPLAGFQWVAEPRAGPTSQDIIEWKCVMLASYKTPFKEKGYYDWHVNVAGKQGQLHPGQRRQTTC